MKKFIYALLCISFLGFANNVYSQEWTKINGLNPYINTIHLMESNPSKIIVASNADSTDLLQEEITLPPVGNGCLVSEDSGKTFNKYFLAGYPVFDICQSKLEPNKWVASVRKITRGGILHSQDNTENWNDFLSCDAVSQIVKISSTIENGKEIFVGAQVNTAEGFVYSDDGFSSCLTNPGIAIQSRYIAFSKISKNLYIAGDHQSSGNVYRSTNVGQTWIKSDGGLEGLRVLCVFPSSQNPAIVFCGADSVTVNKSSIGKGIFMSIDTGRTWTNVGAKGAQVFEIAEHPKNPKLMAAAAGLQGVLVSSVGGKWWENHSKGLPAGKSVRKISIPYWDAKPEGVIALAGVFGDGLYKSTYITSSIDRPIDNNSGLTIESIYPQPASNHATIIWNNPESQSADINIYDSFGNQVFALNNVYFSEGTNTFNWNASESNIAQGVYHIVIKAKNNTASSRIVIIK